MSPTIEDQLIKLPKEPGVYRYYNAMGEILYVGKAANLKRRVSSYFQRPQDRRIADLVRNIATIEWTVTDSVIEALILEANQIQALQPPYNVRQKDDKTFLTIGITKEPFPRVLAVRPTDKLPVPLAVQFGPYTSANHVRIALKLLRRIFPFRTRCRPDSAPGRGCLDYQIGLCPGMCGGFVTRNDYRTTIRHITQFLRRNKRRLVKTLERAMKAQVKTQQFEEAARLRDQIFALQHLKDVALIQENRLENTVDWTESGIPERLEAFDISNIGADSAVGAMVVFEHGQPAPAMYRKFQIKYVVGQNDVAMMNEVIVRRLRHPEWGEPTLFLVDGGRAQLRAAMRALRGTTRAIPIIAVAKGPTRKKLDLLASDPHLLNIPGIKQFERLIHHAREEAHRFAIRYHRLRRGKDFLPGGSSLLA